MKVRLIHCFSVFLFLTSFSQKDAKVDSIIRSLSGKHDTVKVKIFSGISRMYEANDPGKALTFGDSSLKYALKMKDPFWKAAAYSCIGSCLCTAGRYDESIRYHLDAMKIFETAGRRHNLANCYNNLANAYMGNGEQKKAGDYFMKTYELSNQEPKIGGMLAVASFGVGNKFMSEKNFKEALRYFKVAADYFEKNDVPSYAAMAITMMGEAHVQAGELPEAEACFLKVDPIYRRVNDEYGLALNLLSLGTVETAKKNYSKAAKYIKESLDLQIKRNALDNIRAAAKQLSEVNELMGRPDEALRYYKLYEQYKDSVFNKERTKALVDAETKYESEKKEQELKLKNSELEKSQLKVDQRNHLIYVFAAVTVIFIVLLFLVYRSYREKKRSNILLVNKNEEIERQKEVIEEKNKDITDSINYSRHIQQAIIPSSQKLQSLLGESFVIFKPKDIVSGDFYLVEEHVGMIYLAAVDCTGHGVPGAMLSVFADSSIKNSIATNNFRNHPGALLSDLCFQFKINLQSNNSGGNVNDGVDMSLCIVDRKEQKIYFSGARNGLVHVSSDGLHEYAPSRWGISGTNTGEQMFYEDHVIDYRKGDWFYLFTDGFADQFGGPKGKKLKHKNLLEMLRSNSDLTAQEQRRVLEDSYEEWRGKLEQIDDVTLIGFRV